MPAPACSVASEEMPLSIVPLAAKKLDDRWGGRWNAVAGWGACFVLARLAPTPCALYAPRASSPGPHPNPRSRPPLSTWYPTTSLTDIYAPSAAPMPMRRGGLTSLFGLAPAYISLAAKSE